MWNKPWSMKEGFAIGIGLMVTGLMLQFSMKAVEWSLLAWPVNIIVLAFFIVAALMMFAMRSHVYALRFLITYQCAVPALILVSAMTIVMGLTRQVADGQPPADMLGITRMLSFWPFVLLYVYVAVILSQVTLMQLMYFQWRRLPSLISHVGLLITLLTATLGSADMQRLRMMVNKETPEWRVIDPATNKMKELNIAILLKEFTIDEYPPKLMFYDEVQGALLPEGNPATLLIDDDFQGGELQGWQIEVDEVLDEAQPVTNADSTSYVEWHQSGAVTALHVKATLPDGSRSASGWITTGSYKFPYQLLPVTQHQSIVMAEREPQRYLSKVEIMTESGKHEEADILVNQPYSIGGWKIYQLNYDTSRGKWSEISVLELVRDPWLPSVYIGIYLMIAGAVLLLFTAKKGFGSSDNNGQSSIVNSQ
ncbi:MAG: cytochrome c biogenesis protein ResB [Bacteroidaceae bacterium]|nr:cytochrome c biogenesis protein ResB [Bacteroidaceae bacterium]